jgi:hypothetical protein
MIDLGECVVEQLEEDTVEVTGMLEEVRAGATELRKELVFTAELFIHPPTRSFVRCSQAADAKAEKNSKKNGRHSPVRRLVQRAGARDREEKGGVGC